MKKKKATLSKKCYDRWTSSRTFAVGHPQRRMIVCYAIIGQAGSAPGPVNTLASLAESKQNTNEKMKAYLTDIMPVWIITRSQVLR